jgi:hypothetical protein
MKWDVGIRRKSECIIYKWHVLWLPWQISVKSGSQMGKSMKKTNSRPPRGDNISQNIDNIYKSSTFDIYIPRSYWIEGLFTPNIHVCAYVHMYICQSQIFRYVTHISVLYNIKEQCAHVCTFSVYVKSHSQYLTPKIKMSKVLGVQDTTICKIPKCALYWDCTLLRCAKIGCKSRCEELDLIRLQMTWWHAGISLASSLGLYWLAPQLCIRHWQAPELSDIHKQHN